MQHSDDAQSPAPAADPSAAAGHAASRRAKPKPGERRLQILHALAQMLEAPGSDRVTTAALAARLQVSEAALYRHFASKAQMFEALIDFIESSVMGLIRQVQSREADARASAAHILTLMAQFAEANPGMVRVMVGDALVLEHERLQRRMNLLFDKLEGALRQSLRGLTGPEGTPAVAALSDADAQVSAAVMTAFLMGRLQRFVRSGFRHLPSDNLQACLLHML